MLQGRVLGDLIVADGTHVGILALQDAYGTGLAENTEKSVDGGGGEVVETVIYDPKAANFAAEVAKIKAADPDAIVLIGFDETKKIIPELVKQGIGPEDQEALLRRRQPRQLREGLPAGHARRRQGHPARRGGRRRVQGASARRSTRTLTDFSLRAGVLRRRRS